APGPRPLVSLRVPDPLGRWHPHPGASADLRRRQHPPLRRHDVRHTLTDLFAKWNDIVGGPAMTFSSDVPPGSRARTLSPSRAAAPLLHQVPYQRPVSP